MDTVGSTLLDDSSLHGFRAHVRQLLLGLCVVCRLPFCVTLTPDGKARECLEHLCDALYGVLSSGRNFVHIRLEVDVFLQCCLEQVVQQSCLLLLRHAFRLWNGDLVFFELFGIDDKHTYTHTTTLHRAYTDAGDLVVHSFGLHSSFDGFGASMRQLSLGLVVVCGESFRVSFTSEGEVGKSFQHPGKRVDGCTCRSRYLRLVWLELNVPLQDALQQGVQHLAPLLRGLPRHVRDFDVLIRVHRKHPHAHAKPMRASQALAVDWIRGAKSLQCCPDSFRPHLGKLLLGVVVVCWEALGMALASNHPVGKALENAVYLLDHWSSISLDACFVRLESETLVERLFQQLVERCFLLLWVHVICARHIHLAVLHLSSTESVQPYAHATTQCTAI
mmetsp:Transcript_42895/g.74258  ORF Transcript_42895/g.74258 Transcript_42895/m.74258 type:complete len:390 (+) Transcript_42895:609-1778(+)